MLLRRFDLDNDGFVKNTNSSMSSKTISVSYGDMSEPLLLTGNMTALLDGEIGIFALK
jgi:hypothetical protein